jgi:glycine cleavage system H protein
VAEINAALADSPDIINKDPHGGGWLIKVRVLDPRELSELMDANAYERYTTEIAG